MKFGASRVVLLIEIERWCSQPLCSQSNRIGLTRIETKNYHGFECSRCERWNEDVLRERDVPAEWRDNNF